MGSCTSVNTQTTQPRMKERKCSHVHKETHISTAYISDITEYDVSKMSTPVMEGVLTGTVIIDTGGDLINDLQAKY